MAKIEYEKYDSVNDFFSKSKEYEWIEEEIKHDMIETRVHELFKLYPYLDMVGVTDDDGSYSGIFPM